MASTTTAVTVSASASSATAGPTGVTRMQKVRVVTPHAAVVWASAPTRYAWPEGAYGPDYDSPHEYVPQDVGAVNPANPVTNVPGLSLCMIPVRAGTSVTLPTGRGLRVNVDTTFYPSDLSNISGWDGPWDLYFLFVDGNYSDNSGSFASSVTVTDIDGQVPDHIIGLPGAVTQEDYDNAKFCSVLGVLTPANRLRNVDGRVMCDLVAPFKRKPDL